MKRRLLILLLGLSPTFALAAELTPPAKREIAHLLSYLQQSGCDFNRNGSWHATEEAVGHIQKKYEYLLKKNLVSSAEDFIDRAASESSMSGKPYLVRCGAHSPASSATWFKAELTRYRKRSQ